ncbi:hypothetical protein GQ53DRAFT_811309 [Thozetella sp. PMI_491]|nr:hypothetical protein GQ53DRAFT_811309 [Thozetella sp. PMI_491]
MVGKGIINALVLASRVLAASPVRSAEGLVFNVLLASQATIGGPFDLAVRLNQYNPLIGLPAFFDFYVGVDSNSPTLVGNLESGVLYAQGVGPHVHAQPDGILSGWRLCVADFDSQYGPWSFLQYVTYTGTAIGSRYCEDVTVQTTITS